MKSQTRNLKKSWILCLTFVFMTMLIHQLTPMTTSHAAETTGYTTADLNLRKKPSTSSKVLKTFSAGTKISITGSDGDWYKVTSGKKTGYVSKEYVTSEWVAYSTTDNLNLRKKASTSSKVLKQLDAGDKVTVLSKSGDWYKVKSGSKTGYLRNDYITFQYCGYADGTGINMRKGPSTSTKIVTTLGSGDKVTILDTEGKWYKVRYEGKEGYIRKDLITFDESEATGSLGESIVAYAMQFLGNPYRYGGTSLTNGADCSGFTQSVFAHFGIYLPRSSSAQRYVGTKVNSLSEAQPGDLICYYGHVGIYIGGNAVIHASSERSGIKITYNAAYRRIASSRRLVQLYKIDNL